MPSQNATFQCRTRGCDFTANTGRALAMHKCDKRITAITELLNSDLDFAPASKRRKLNQGNALEITHQVRPNSSPPPPPPMSPRAPSPAAPSTRSGRRVRMPAHFQDYVPTCASTVLPQWGSNIPPPMRTPTPEPEPPSDASHEIEDLYLTPADSFGVYRGYSRIPQHDPILGYSPSVGKAREESPPVDGARAYDSIFWMSRTNAISVRDPSEKDYPKFGPFGGNATLFRLVDWSYDDSVVMSRGKLDAIIDIIRSPGFDPDDLMGMTAKKAERLLDTWVGEEGRFSAQDGWRTSTIRVPLPRTGTVYRKEEDCPTYEIPGIIHRNLCELIRGVVADPQSRFRDGHHWVPHTMYWMPPVPGDSGESRPHSPNSSPSEAGEPEPIRVWCDTANSDAMLEEDAKVRNLPPHPDDPPNTENVILPLMVYSDATMLSNFGSAKLWPIYLYFLNVSKYIRSRPTEFAANYVAYIPPQVPDSIKEAYKDIHGVVPNEEVQRFFKREMFNNIWSLLLDEDFKRAYREGMFMICGDELPRRLFPRPFIYSADYPEKMLVACLKSLGNAPSPGTLVLRIHFPAAGTPEDDVRRAQKRLDNVQTQNKIKKARRLIFQGKSFVAKKIKDMLFDESLLPTQSAFSQALAPLGHDTYQMLAPDLMHEFELGVWKKTFEHLVRLIQSLGAERLHEFNLRMRKLPAWGHDRIRRIHQDVESQKRLAARDFEAYLVIILPVVKGLFPQGEDEIICDMLFELSAWHAFAKLRMHHEVTLANFRATVRHMYAAVRAFAHEVCALHQTFELDREAAARSRRELQKDPQAKVDGAARPVQYGVLGTPKYYQLGEYPDWIERHGCSDVYNAQTGEFEHILRKRLYARTNKVEFEQQIAEKERRRALLDTWRANDDYIPAAIQRHVKRKRDVAQAEEKERDDYIHEGKSLSASSPMDHYHISLDERVSWRLQDWARQHSTDAAVQDFIPRLREHLAMRFLGGDMYAEPDDLSSAQIDGVIIRNDRLYSHRLLRINYTSYDCRREEYDVINPRKSPDIMVYAPEWDASYPFWFARVLGIFHVQAQYVGPGHTLMSRKMQRIDLLWVRWFTLDTNIPQGFYHRRQPHLQFVDANDPDNAAFSFIDPDTVIRSAYIMPDFASGTTDQLLGHSKLGRPMDDEDEDEDYGAYQVSMFADRDIFMRHHGGGIGHHGLGRTLTQSKQNGNRAERVLVHEQQPPAQSREPSLSPDPLAQGQIPHAHATSADDPAHANRDGPEDGGNPAHEDAPREADEQEEEVEDEQQMLQGTEEDEEDAPGLFDIDDGEDVEHSNEHGEEHEQGLFELQPYLPY